MIFGPELIDKVLSSEKTQTRRPVKYNGTPGETWVRRPCRYEPGKTYAVQPGRGKKAVARIEVIGVWREKWRDIDEAQARAEGFGRHPRSTTQFSARDQFLAYVRDLYPDLDENAECWVIEFKLASVVTDLTGRSSPNPDATGEITHDEGDE